MGDRRAGEAIGALRRAANLGTPGMKVWPLLAEAFCQRSRWVAALGAYLEGRAAGVPEEVLRGVYDQVEASLGPQLGPVLAVLKARGEGRPSDNPPNRSPGSSA
jgi:hypothetical protein